MKITMLLALFAAPPALAQPVPTAPIAPLSSTSTLLTVAAEGESRRAPDVALFNAGVVTQGATAAEAMAANSRRMDQVIAVLRRAGVAEQDIQTSAINLQPRYSNLERDALIAARTTGQPHVPPGQPSGPRIIGYEARNNVQVRSREIDEMGRIIDALVAAGANEVNGPSFTMEDLTAAMNQARLEAIANGRARAELYARAAGLRVQRIVSISEGGPTQPLPVMAAARAEMAPSTPVAPGELTLGVTVVMQFELTR